MAAGWDYGDYRTVLFVVAVHLADTLFGPPGEAKAAAFFAAQAVQAIWVGLAGVFGALALIAAAQWGWRGMWRRAVAGVLPLFLIWPLPAREGGAPQPLGWVLARKAMVLGVTVGGWIAGRLPGMVHIQSGYGTTLEKQTIWEEEFARSQSDLGYQEYRYALQFLLLPRGLADAETLREARETVDRVGRELEERYSRVVTGELEAENATQGWARMKALFRRAQENWGRAWKIYTGRILGAGKAMLYTAGALITRDPRLLTGAAQGVAQAAPEWVLREVLIAMGLPAFVLLWSVSFYAAILLWALRTGWFAVFFPIKAIGWALRGDLDRAAGAAAGSTLSIAVTPTVLALNSGLALWGMKIYVATVPAILRGLIALLGASTHGASGWFVAPWWFGKLWLLSVGAGVGWAVPFALVNLILPHEIERLTEGVTHALAPRIERVLGGVAA